MRALLGVAQAKAQVRVHIENTLIRFKTQFFLQNNGAVVLGKPAGVDGILSAGSYVRMRLSGADKTELRLRVILPHLNLENGKTAFVCGPSEHFMRCRRKSDRYEVLKYRNIHLIADEEPYRIADFSTHGLGVLLSSTQSADKLPGGRVLKEARLQLGGEAQVNFEWMIPRNRHDRIIGCEFKVASQPRSERYFHHLLDSLTRVDLQRANA
jgi:hypothetical protein